ncbi:MAG: UDP-N-acetylmuramoyl-L-alanine--D-glutamate ligase [Prevotella sp.]|nr:UDP-N-acetylmuramoyl-L-alanine--D-glutamate ligase [Prevotella sp.]
MKKLVILGAGESGAGVALLAKKNGCDVFVSDSGRIKDNYKALLNEKNIAWEEGSHDTERILSADEIMKSPGVPDTADIIKRIVDKGIPVVSEIEFCARYLHGRTICVTGSNGKTTTTTLIYEIMRRAGKAVALGGNIGKSLAMQLVAGNHDWYVLELSSFQLDNCYDFRADVAVLMNITPDHLDRYDFQMQHYVDSKMRIMQNQTPADTFIYWADDEHIPRELERRRRGETIAKPVLSSRAAKAGNPSLRPFVDADFERLGLEMHLFGNHNKRNALAAYYATLAAGVDESTVRQTIREFKGVEHRLEYVATKGGADYINDSKATNVDACRVALEAMTRPTVLIIGGTDKGNDYNVIIPLVKKNCRAVVFLGADNTKLHACFDRLGLPTADTRSMKDCVAACKTFAREGDAVLLSPCCASFDLFKNMEDRGEQFVNCVKEL